MIFPLILSTVYAFGSNCPLVANPTLLQSQVPAFIPNSRTKIAFIGDQGLGANPVQVLRMIKKYKADVVIIAGDLDYQDAPKLFMHQFTDTMGKGYPLLVVPGNHDILNWFQPENGYKALLETQQVRSTLSNHCVGELGINQYCLINNMIFVLSGVGTLGANHAEFIDSVFTKHRKIPWKVCVWHKNQRNLQTGDKSDETGYLVYETCRKHGAFVITGHEHSYERTHLLSNFASQTIYSKNNHMILKPGVSFSVVSGLGGESIRPWQGKRYKSPWFAAAASSNNSVNYGALLCKFKKYNGSCEFRDIDGKVWDQFTLDSSKNTRKLPIDLQSVAAEADSLEVPIESLDDISGTHSIGKKSLILFGNSTSFGKEARLQYKLNGVDLPKVKELYLQFMGHAIPDSPPATIKITADQTTSHPLFVQGTKKRTNSLTINIPQLEHGDVWVSPNLLSLVDTSLFSRNSAITFYVQGSVLIPGEFGFVASHEDSATCTSPTMYLKF